MGEAEGSIMADNDKILIGHPGIKTKPAVSTRSALALVWSQRGYVEVDTNGKPIRVADKKTGE